LDNLINGTPDPADDKLYKKYFIIKETPVRGVTYSIKEDAIRMSVASEENFEGKLFVQFVALQIVSYIKKQMDEHGLFNNYTIQSLLDELDVIEYYQQPGKTHHLSEITEKQKNLYEMMNVSVPT
jgi:transposase